MNRTTVAIAVLGLGILGCQLVLPLHHATEDGGGLPDVAQSAPDSAQSAPDSAQSGGDSAHEGDTGGQPPACGEVVVTLDPGCNTCLTQSCCVPSTQCVVTDRDCNAIITCQGACAAFDFTCKENCVGAHPSGEADYLTFVECQKKQCSGPGEC